MDQSDDGFQSIVFDSGSHTIAAGFAGDDAPREVFPTLIGRPRKPYGESVVRDVYVGDEAQSKREVLSLDYPLRGGEVTNWDDMEKIWHHTCYNALCIAPEAHPFLMTEGLLCPKEDREKMTQIMFETFNVPAYFPISQPLLSLYASGRMTGVVVSCGEGVCHTVPIYEGFVVQHAVQKLSIGGQDVTDYLIKCLSERGYLIAATSNRETYREMKEKIGYVAFNFDKEESWAAEYCSEVEKEYELPDGNTIRVGKERFQCTEPLFRPSLVGKEDPGLAEMAYTSIMKCDINARRYWYGNLVLGGASSLFPGFGERFRREIQELAPSTMSIKVVSPPERKYSAWIGGSIFASLSSFERIWVSKEEYDEYGPMVVHRKCLH